MRNPSSSYIGSRVISYACELADASLTKMTKSLIQAEPRWPALLALLGVCGLRMALPDALSIGPRWLLFFVVGLLAVPTVWARLGERHGVNQVFGYVLNGVITADTLWSLGLLLRALPSHKESPLSMLGSAAALWLANILVFASWYWRLDAGGPHQRDLRTSRSGAAFLFPQMSLDNDLKEELGVERWSPQFMDYLFLAFNTSTAFSPTDVPVLSRWAKALMMIQALISFTTVALLAARAVNIL